MKVSLRDGINTQLSGSRWLEDWVRSLRGDDKVFGLKRVCKCLFYVARIAAVF